ncbi:energy-coupling factor transport system permease protein [Propionibacterium cyclohexanicum]|uniref:Energy-coupling factor transport system permease protein n=1 Tax=Propionibacterium cyclohexanicum TaxID=64702 RepID=A0A1H9RSX3_9ACTN|nr:energy-coupling factor transporter transmembrane component T [Propionibacterium cyclohexanicum]SER75694.1 energy-coupling factor transport system permease protein [Propionibacterium cyclohexanicum]
MTVTETTVTTESPSSGPRFDPRSLLPCVVALVGALLANTPRVFELGALVLLIALLLVLDRWRWLVIIMAGGVLVAALSIAVGRGAGQGVAALLAGTLLLWRYIMAAGFGVVLISALVPAQLLALLRAYRVPDAVTVPLMVMIRYIPTLADTARAIADAMRVRGILHGPLDLVVRPLSVGRRLVVPLIAAAVRGGDDLTAAALTRGLGCGQRATSITCPRLSWWDGALCTATIAVLALVVWS